MERKPTETRFGSRRKGGSSKPIIIVAILSFILGSAGVGYLTWRYMDQQQAQLLAEAASDDDTALVSAEQAEPETENTPSAEVAEAAEEVTESVEEAAEAVERVAEQQGGIDQRLAAAEQRLTRLDLQAQAASGNAARAEGLLIAFAARRNIERGEGLGDLTDQLRLRFSDNWPNAVRTVINFSRDPVTLDELLARLEGLGPEISQTSEGPSWAKFKQELSQLFVIRRESTPSPQPTRRLERARLFLETGRVEAAIKEVRFLPGAAQAGDWISDAERYAEATEALAVLEAAAVLDPNRVRDGSGQRIEQESPVAGSRGGQ